MVEFERNERIKIAFYITFFYRENRLKFLYFVLRNIGEFLGVSVCIHIFTNVKTDNEIDKIRNIVDIVTGGNVLFHIHSEDVEENPQFLTWSHKKIMKKEYEAAEYDYYVYLEDDIRLSFSNFLYFVNYREKLKKFNLIPGFMRVEYNYVENDIYWADNTEALLFHDELHASKIEIENDFFVSHKFPYAAMFILDRELCKEYFSSRSSDINESFSVFPWNVSERSAMGLTWESVPKGFVSRLVVPVSKKAGKILPACLIDHLPSNYTNAERGDLLGSYKLNDSIVVSSCDNIFPPSIENIISNKWSFGPMGRKGNGIIEFFENGTFVGDTTPNERYWEIDGDLLKIYNEDRLLSWRFIFFEKNPMRAVGKSTPLIGNFSFELKQIL